MQYYLSSCNSGIEEINNPSSSFSYNTFTFSL